MKTKAFLFIFLLFGISMAQVSAQGSDTRAWQGWFQSSYYTPVFCGDVMVDYLEGGVISVHYVVFRRDGKYQWETDKLKGEVTSQTGEVFKISELDKTYFTDHWYVTWHYNLIGNRGTHYIGTLTYSYWTGETTVGMTVCH
jgi:hypothetical protein